jgi:hypothetical protein
VAGFGFLLVILIPSVSDFLSRKANNFENKLKLESESVVNRMKKVAVKTVGIIVKAIDHLVSHIVAGYILET